MAARSMVAINTLSGVFGFGQEGFSPRLLLWRTKRHLALGVSSCCHGPPVACYMIECHSNRIWCCSTKPAS
ncbi:hypothetical protein BDR03DRAFT_692377 [Suillus americanus]|nr:hypothetical protein BDR03DRAFT_692377 [Suillus americanus]